jgi:hypothetical protein
MGQERVSCPLRVCELKLKEAHERKMLRCQAHALYVMSMSFVFIKDAYPF